MDRPQRPLGRVDDRARDVSGDARAVELVERGERLVRHGRMPGGLGGVPRCEVHAVARDAMLDDDRLGDRGHDGTGRRDWAGGATGAGDATGVTMAGSTGPIDPAKSGSESSSTGPA